MIIAITCQKGGVGKSTIATNLSVALALGGGDIILVDADRQATSANWANDRGEVKHSPVVHVVQKYDNIKSTLIDLAGRYDHVIADCAGRDSREMRSAMLAADIAIVPVRCSQPDLDVLDFMNGLVAESRDYNPKLKAFVVLSLVPTNPVIKEENDARRIVADFPDLVLLNTRLCDRKVFRDAMAGGKGVVELDYNKGRDEIASLLEELTWHSKAEQEPKLESPKPILSAPPTMSAL